MTFFNRVYKLLNAIVVLQSCLKKKTRNSSIKLHIQNKLTKMNKIINLKVASSNYKSPNEYAPKCSNYILVTGFFKPMTFKYPVTIVQVRSLK